MYTRIPAHVNVWKGEKTRPVWRGGEEPTPLSGALWDGWWDSHCAQHRAHPPGQKQRRGGGEGLKEWPPHPGGLWGQSQVLGQFPPGKRGKKAPPKVAGQGRRGMGR